MLWRVLCITRSGAVICGRSPTSPRWTRLLVMEKSINEQKQHEKRESFKKERGADQTVGEVVEIRASAIVALRLPIRGS